MKENQNNCRSSNQYNPSVPMNFLDVQWDMTGKFSLIFLKLMRQRVLGTLLLMSMFIVAFHQDAEAGGSSFTAEITAFEYHGNDEFTIILQQYTLPYSPDIIEPRTLILHLRHKTHIFKSSTLRTEEEYRRGINLLLQQYRQGGMFQFGVWANGFTPIDGHPGEYQSNGLNVIDGVVMSWADID